MAFDYKLEYGKAVSLGDDAVYVHMRIDPHDYYRFQTGKEDYSLLDSTSQDGLANGLFNVAGIEEISVTAYRVWYMKSPAYNWKEVNNDALSFMKTFFGEDSLNQMVGSAAIDGTGLRVETTDRRSTKAPS